MYCYHRSIVFLELCDKMYDIRMKDPEEDPAKKAKDNLRRMGNILDSNTEQFANMLQAASGHHHHNHPNEEFLRNQSKLIQSLGIKSRKQFIYYQFRSIVRSTNEGIRLSVQYLF
jgi:hypothetical protein